MMKNTKECIILAAGLSRRMGKWKMMMPWGAGTILDSALDSALSFCDRVVLVTGFRGDELRSYYQEHPKIDVVFNPDYRDGMFSSIQRGVASITSSRFFLALGDMPEVKPSVYRTLWQHREDGVCLIPGYDRGKGHPVLLPEKAIAMIKHAPEGATLKDIIHQLGTHVVPVSEQGIHWDVDTPAQYEALAQLTFLQ